MRWLGQRIGSYAFFAKTKQWKNLFALLLIQLSVVEREHTQNFSLARQFRAIGAAPHPDVELPDEESMHQNRASWHKTCRMKYFFRHLLSGSKSSPEQENSWEILSVSQMAMLNMTSLSSNLNREPPLAVLLALELHSQTRSKKLVELLHKYNLSVSYKKVLSIEASFAKAIGDRTRNSADIVCPTNLRQCIFTVAALDNLDHNPTSRTATSSFHGTGISLFQFPTTQKPGLDQECLRINSHTEAGSSGPILPHSYTFVPPVGQNQLIAFLNQVHDSHLDHAAPGQRCIESRCEVQL